MASVGILMFGDYVRDEITSNILLTKGYPEAISLFIVICIAIIPITKIPLNSRPIVATLEIVCGIDPRALPAAVSMTGMSGFNRGLLKITIRVSVTITLVIIAIIFPSFDRIMTLMGSVACFTICVILPLGFHLKLFGKEIPKWERYLDWGLIGISSVMALVSTGFAFVPKELLGA
jgi:solute carrier family 32 (vesicular inhibitory amino acid transporter)